MKDLLKVLKSRKRLPSFIVDSYDEAPTKWSILDNVKDYAESDGNCNS